MADNFGMAVDIIWNHKLFHSDDPDYNKDSNTNFIEEEQASNNGDEVPPSRESTKWLGKPKDLTIFS